MANEPKKAKKKATTGADTYTHQAVNQFHKFFDYVMGQADTDKILVEAGLSRKDLEVLTFDDEIDSHIDRRKDNLKKSNWILNTDDEITESYVSDMLESHFDTITKSAINARMYGFSVCEFLYEPQANTDLPKFVDVIEKPMDWFEPTNMGTLFLYKKTGLPKQEVDTNLKFLLQRNEPEWENPKGKALLSRVYWLWFFKKNGWRFWSKFLERFGTPILVATGCDDPKSTAKALVDAHNQSAIALPDEEDLKAVGATGNGETFQAFDSTINKRIAKYLVGQTLTTGTDNGGTYGQGQIHQEQQQIIFDSDKSFATKSIQKFINIICFCADCEPPEFEWVDEKGLQIDRSERDKNLQASGLEYDLSYFTDIYDIETRHIAKVNGVLNPDAENYESNKSLVDNSPVSNVDNSFSMVTKPKAKQLFSFTHSSGQKFSSEQQRVEDTVDEFVDKSGLPFDEDDIVDIILKSSDVKDMANKLFSLVGEQVSRTQFALLMQEALCVADVLGYVDALNESETK